MHGSVTGTPKRLLQLEGLFVLTMAAFLYSRFGMGWGMFALWFLAPDLAMIGYAGGRKAGAFLYNMTHSYMLPFALLAWGVYSHTGWALGGGLIWMAHIGFDRMLGYGLKYGAGFRFTHMSCKDKAAEVTA